MVLEAGGSDLVLDSGRDRRGVEGTVKRVAWTKKTPVRGCSCTDRGNARVLFGRR